MFVCQSGKEMKFEKIVFNFIYSHFYYTMLWSICKIHILCIPLISVLRLLQGNVQYNTLYWFFLFLTIYNGYDYLHTFAR